MAKNHSGHGPANPDQSRAGGGHGPKAGHDDGNSYATFTFSADKTKVESMTLGNSAGGKEVDIAASSFKTTVGTNDLGATAVIGVEETRSTELGAATRIYKDTDGDGQYNESFGIRVAASDNLPLRQHEFTFNADGTIASDSARQRDQWREDAIQSNEVYARLALGDDSYVVKTVADAKGYHFEVFRDDNADGIWTEIASGHSAGDFIDTTSGTVNLVGIQDYLAAAAQIVG